MMYDVYFNQMRLPITPAKLTLKVKGNNKTLTLANDGEMNFLRLPGLTEISLDVVLPMLGRYSFSSKYFRPDYYLGVFEKLMTSRKPFRFIVSRVSPSGELLYDTNIKVSLEDYTVTEDAKNGPDVTVSISLKQHADYTTKIVKVIESESKKALVEKTPREAGGAPEVKTHTVKSGDTLWLIAKKYYGDGAQYMKIYNANKSILSSPNSISVGQVLTIPDANSVETVAAEAENISRYEKYKFKQLTVNIYDYDQTGSSCYLQYHSGPDLVQKDNFRAFAYTDLVNPGSKVRIVFHCKNNAKVSFTCKGATWKYGTNTDKAIDITMDSDATIRIDFSKR